MIKLTKELIKAVELLVKATKEELQEVNKYIIKNWPISPNRNKALDAIQKVFLTNYG